MVTLTAKSKKSDIIHRINHLRGQYELGYPKGEAVLDTISNANLIKILHELEAEIAKYEAGDEPEAEQADQSETTGPLGDLLAANRVPELKLGEDFDPITDPPVTAEELENAQAKIAANDASKIANLLAQLQAEKSQSERKKIRAALRKAGYKISEHRSK